MSSKLSRFDEPQDVTEGAIAYGGKTSELLPPWKELPEEYRKGWHHGEPHGCALAIKWFFHGIAQLEFRKGIDNQKAGRHLHACMCSWEPKHEHKIAGVGWLLDHWGAKEVKSAATTAGQAE